jgi:DNA-binding MarR family transcriptional regulator
MVNISKLKLTNLQEDILRLLFIKTGISLNQRRIAEILKVSQPAVMKALPKLQKQDLVEAIQDKESKRWSIELNRENQNAIWLKRADNLKQIYESGLVQFLYDKLPGATIMLFGSYSSGEDTINSDIDLAAIGIKNKELDLTKFDKMLERKIIINYYDSFQDINKNLLNNILNGITLKGAVKI